MKLPDWLPRPASLAVAVFAGGIIGLIEARRDERKRLATEAHELWQEAIVSESVESPRSGNAGTDQTDGATADSGVPMPDVPPMALHEQITDKEAE